MKKTEETATETLTQGHGGIFLIDEGGVVQLIFFEGNGQVFIVVGGDRVDRSEDDRLDFLKARQRACSQGRFSRVIVSPIWTSETVLTPAIM